MRALLDLLSPGAALGAGALVGVAGGVVAGRVADLLPGRYGITLLTTGGARGRRNVVVALLGAAIGAWLAHRCVSYPDTSALHAAFYFSVNLTLGLALLAAAAVDLEHMVLPNELTLGGAAVAVSTAHWRGVGLIGSLVGVVAGLLLTYLPFVLYKWLRGRSGMGLGDAKLALFAGAWLGAPGAIFVVFAGAVQSALCAVIMRIFGVSFAVPASVQAELAELRAKAAAGDEEARSLLDDDPMAANVVASPARDDTGPASRGHEDLATMRLPMGPFLVLACLEWIFAQRQIVMLFDRYLGPP